MNAILSEINEIPARAKDFLQSSKDFTLPTGVPYIGMGSSYFAPLAFKYMGLNVQPEIASEFYNYLSDGKKLPNGVLLSQSGRSTEVLWCTERFQKFTAVTNTPGSRLATNAVVENVVELLAGEEKYSSSKTYINTLLALFKGFGMNAGKAVELLERKMPDYDAKGKALAEEFHRLMQAGNRNGIYITGSGPNIATAMEAALILSESTKLDFHGLPMPQYDHGPKETAKNSVVIQIVCKGKAYDRTKKLSDTIRSAGGHVLEVEEPAATENESILHNIVPFNYMAYYLSALWGVQETFIVGGKVTEVA